ncbi:MAG TPA: aldehyde ferredoxin oxidoreductase [Anaerolineae bacterium]|nr:aldehyde ferredoxin oxidoreductase [Anaerolineae bacterium]
MSQSRVWRADVEAKTVKIQPVPDSWERLGGRGLIARILLDEVPPACDPLGSENKLIWAPGLLVGHRISSCDRISLGAKSPLTGGVKESNAGGMTGWMLSHLGMKALILEGRSPDDGVWVLCLNAEGGRFERMDELAGLGAYEAAERLLERFGSDVGLSLIGPGGEMFLRSAGVLNVDKDHEPSRISARGGLGAVMGSKRVKAVVIDAAGGEAPEIADPVLFTAANKQYLEALLAHPQTQTYADYGTAAMTAMSNEFGALPTRGYAAGTFEGAERIGGEYLRDLLLTRKGEGRTTHACMAGCAVRCSNVFAGEDGRKIVSPLEYETIALVGSNLGIDNLDAIARINRELNDLGLDTIEIGAALGVAARAGWMDFGDAERALELIAEMRAGSAIGRQLGNGASATGEALGVERIPAVKGQSLAAYDPRAVKGTGVTYATSPQGADHTAGLTIRARIDHLDPEGQAELSRKAQISIAGYDTLGVCLFATFGFAKAPGAVRDLVKGRYGWDVDDAVLNQLGEETIQLERQFNQAAGFGPADDRLPAWMSTEPLPPHNSVFDVPEEDLDGVFD